ncbi:MAG: DUF4349 domain-containing protein [Capsulimonadaceae bacterium]
MIQNDPYAGDLKAYADRELSFGRRLAVRRHLAQCAVCRKELKQMTQIAEQVRAVEAAGTNESMDPALRSRIVNSYPAQFERTETRSRKRPLLLALGAAAAAVGIAVSIVYLHTNSQPRMEFAAIPESPPPPPTWQGAEQGVTEGRGIQQSYLGAVRLHSSQTQSVTAGAASPESAQVLNMTKQAGVGPQAWGSHPAVPADGATATPDDAGRVVHKEASITVEVDDPEARSDAIEDMARAAGGFVAENNLSTGDDGLRTASLTVKVPEPQFETVLGQVAKLGSVTAKNVTGEDITEKTSDAREQEGVMEDEAAQAQQHLDRLGKHATWIDNEDAREVRVELAQARGRLELLRKLGQLSVLDITLNQKPKPVPPPSNGFLSGMSDTTKSAVQSLIGSVSTVLTMVIWIVAYVPIWGPILWGVRYGLKRRTGASQAA